MASLATLIGNALDKYAATVDDTVSVSHEFSGGSQQWSATRSETMIDPMWEIDGRRVAKAYTLLFRRDAVDYRLPQEGEVVRVAKGDETAVEMVVKRVHEQAGNATVRISVAQEWSA